MKKLPPPYTVPPEIAAVMSLETYPLSITPDIDRSRVQRVADAMYQFKMLKQPFNVSTMLAGRSGLCPPQKQVPGSRQETSSRSRIRNCQ